MTPSVLLDSGAFSCWTIGTSIGLDDYIQYLKTNKALLAGGYISLDVIPGRDRQREWRADLIEQAARQSYENWLKMRDAGLQPWPVFHMGESFTWLQRYLADGADHIALSPHRGDRISIDQWLEQCFKLLCDGDGRPLVRVHGLAMTSTRVLLRYPWSSTDSSRFVHVSGNGLIIVPRYRSGQPDYSLQPITVAVTERHRYRKNHIDEINGFKIDCVRAFLNDVGMDIEQVQVRLDRARAFFTYFAGLEHYCRERHGTQFKIFHVATTAPGFRRIFDRCGVNHHLLSYAKLKDCNPSTLKNYVKGIDG